MKRSAQSLLAILFTLAPLMAQEGGKSGEAEAGPNMILLWVNFAILAGGLTYLVRKFGAPFLASRSAKIQRDMTEAAEQRKNADERAAEVDRRLANLDVSLAELRAESQKETELQRKRMAEHTQAEIAKIRNNVEQEIASAGKAARGELKRFTAQLAIQLAEQKIQSRITPKVDDALLQAFLRGLPKTASKAQAN